MLDIEQITALAQERIDELDKGLYIVDLKITSTNQILIEIDALQGAVAIVDCMSVSRNVEHNLDREEVDFELQVTSPGLDKPFKVIQQYQKNIGKAVKTKIEGAKIEGVLKSVTDDGIVIETERKERLEGKKKKIKVVEDVALAFSDIIETKVVISFK
jgi:ribosome maturation factor RimP